MPVNVTIDSDVEMKTSDGITLRADVYRPSDGRHPVLLTRTPYGKGLIPGLLMTPNPVRLAQAGFAVVIQDVRGRYASEGDHTPFDEGADGAEAVQWASTQPWSNGRVGMFGSSYQGASQMQAGARAPAALAVIAPFQASSNYGEGRSFRGGAFELAGLASVAMWNQGAGALQRAGHRGQALRDRFAALRRALSDMRNFLSTTPYENLRGTILGEAAPKLFEWWEHDDKDDAYWHELSLEHRYGRFTTPALHVTSWYDAMHVGTLRNYEGLRREATTEEAREGQALIVGPWGHYPPKTSLMSLARIGDMDFSLDSIQDLESLQLSWFRRWLQDDETAWKNRSRVRLFVMGRNAWRDEEDWPLARAVVEPFYLRGGADDGRILREEGGDEAVDAFTFDPRNPVPTRGGAHMLLESVFPQGPLDQADLEGREDVLVYRGDVLDSELEVTGWLRAQLWVRSSAPSTDFTVKLVDQWPEGRSFNICDGIRRVRIADQRLENGWYEVIVELGATSMAFLPGHRLCVHVSSSNVPRFDLNPNTGETPRTATERVPAHQEICVGGPNASRLLLPVVCDQP